MKKYVRIPSFIICKAKGEKLTASLFKAQVNLFFEWLKEWANKKYGSSVVVSEPAYYNPDSSVVKIQLKVHDRKDKFHNSYRVTISLEKGAIFLTRPEHNGKLGFSSKSDFTKRASKLLLFKKQKN